MDSWSGWGWAGLQAFLPLLPKSLERLNLLTFDSPVRAASLSPLYSSICVYAQLIVSLMFDKCSYPNIVVCGVEEDYATNIDF